MSESNQTNPGSKEVEPALEPCPFCPYPTECYYAVRDVGWLHDRETTRRVVAVCSQCGAQGPAFGVMSFNNKETASQYWNRRAAIPMTDSAGAAVDENSVAFQAYNQAIEDAKAAIRGENVDDPYAAPAFINAIVRKCSPHVYATQVQTKHDTSYADGYNDGFRQGRQSRAAAASPAPKEEEARPRKIFDAGFSAKPSGAAREAAGEIANTITKTQLDWAWLSLNRGDEKASEASKRVAPEIGGKVLDQIAGIISRYFPATAESGGPRWQVSHAENPNAFCLVCNEHPCKLITTAHPAPLVSDCDPDD